MADSLTPANFPKDEFGRPIRPAVVAVVNPATGTWGGSGGGGGGDASAANQVTGNNYLQTIANATTDTTPSPVKIDQTTPGTTNGVVVNSAALATNAAQETGGNLATTATNTGATKTSVDAVKGDTASIVTNTAAGASRVVTGNVASGATDTGNGVKISGYYTTVSTGINLSTNGQRGDILINSRGAVVTAISGKAAVGTDGQANAVYCERGDNAQGGSPLATAGWTWNGSSYDRLKKPNIRKRIASSAAAGNPDFLKASPGDLTSVWGEVGATKAYLQIYDKTSAPVLGTDTPVLTYPLPANSTFSQSFQNFYFPTGIAFAFTTDAGGGTGSAAGALVVFGMTGA